MLAPIASRNDCNVFEYTCSNNHCSISLVFESCDLEYVQLLL